MSYQIYLYTTAGAKTAVLENATNIQRTQKINQTPTLSFSLPCDDAKAVYITSAYEAKVWNTKKSRFEGLYTLDDCTENWSASGSIINANYSGYMLQLSAEQNITYDTGVTPLTPTVIITALLNKQQHTPAITVGTIQPTQTFAFAIENANILESVLKCVSYLGGYVEVDANRALNWYNEPSGNPTREIRYQKNMKGVTRKRDFTNIANRIYAYGFGEPDNTQVTLIDAGEAHEYIENGASQTAYGIKGRRITDKRIIHPSTLLRWAQLILAQFKDPIYFYTVDVVNLAEHSDFSYDYESLEIGQIVRVVNSDLNNLSVNVKLCSVDCNLSNPQNISVELANVSPSLEDSFNDVKNYQNLIQNVAVAIGAGQVVVQGTFTVDGWRSAGVTTIDGGKITAASISVNKLDFTVVGSTNVVASINASAEGITINANRIKVNGDCTFSAGYDPTGKIAAAGAAADVNANTTTISGGKITANSIDCDRLTTSTINAKTITLGTTGGDAIIKSGNYSAGSAGWQIKADGSAEFSNVTVRGTIAACTLSSGSVLNVIGNIKSDNYVAFASGWFLGGNGRADFTEIICNGQITTSTKVGAEHGFQMLGNMTDGNAELESLYTNNGYNLCWKDAGGRSRTILPT